MNFPRSHALRGNVERVCLILAGPFYVSVCIRVYSCSFVADLFKGKKMYAIEFRARIKDGLIEIPEKFRDRLKDNVKVILLTEHEIETSPESDIIEELLESPLKLADFKPYKREEVYDRT